jgi:hypothetical protein
MPAINLNGTRFVRFFGLLKYAVMDLRHFHALSQEGQKETVLKRAVYLSERQTDYFNILLYQLDGFYIEVFTQKSDHTIVWIKSFTSTEQLGPYLCQIDLSNLL